MISMMTVSLTISGVGVVPAKRPAPKHNRATQQMTIAPIMPTTIMRRLDILRSLAVSTVSISVIYTDLMGPRGAMGAVWVGRKECTIVKAHGAT